MDRSIFNLRRALLAAAFLGSLGLGATQAVAEPAGKDYLACSPELGQGDEYCNAWCVQQGALGGGCSTKFRQCMCLYP